MNKDIKNKESVYGSCITCDNVIYEHMEENKEIFDLTSLCGICATGESAVYFDEL